MKTDAISELSFFSTLARNLSLTATARELAMTPPAVTKRLAVMEARLGIRLLNRTTRRVSLTHEGEVYLSHASRILAGITEMEEAVTASRAEPRGLLRVNASLGFGRTAIAPLISAFANRYPDIEVQLHLSDRPMDLVEDAFDLGIRFGELPDTRLSARRLLTNQRFLCASPTYLQRAGQPVLPADLARHQCILHRQNNDAFSLWRLARGKKVESVKVRGTLSSNDGDVVLGWALAHHGILLRSEWDLARYLDSGRLERVLPAYTLPSADLYAYYPSRHHLSAKVRALIDFLVVSLGDAGRTHPERQASR